MATKASQFVQLADPEGVYLSAASATLACMTVIAERPMLMGFVMH